MLVVEMYPSVIGGNAITGDIWFMCSLNSYILEDPSVLDCTDFCGTVDEECNSTSIGNATCSDVGCTGSGEPSCTDKCRLDYSTCSAGTDQTLFELDLTTDGNARQTSWEIRDDDGVVMWQLEGFYWNYLSYNEIRCMENGCYEFELFDSGGDGICCGENNGDIGSYSMLVDEVEVCGNNASFVSSIKHNIGTCSDSTCVPSSQPTMFPTQSPTLSPSASPSLLPSLIPSHSPSEHPSLSPSELSSVPPTMSPSSPPSINPSSQPSISHSSIPSLSPSLVPTFYPSVKHSTIPSLVPSLLPSLNPSSVPSVKPSTTPSLSPSSSPSINPSLSPSINPSLLPSLTPSTQPTSRGVVILVDSTPVENSGFGEVLGISGDSIYISAPDSGKGLVVEFSLEGVFLSDSGGGASGDDYGQGLAVLGDLLVIGSPGKQRDDGEAYILSKSNAFSEITIDASDSRTVNAQRFGSAVAMSSSAIVIGASLADLSGTARGTAYIFDTSGNEQAKIVAPTSESFDNAQFGERLAMSDNNIFVAAYRQESNKGAVHVFDLSGSYVFSLKGEAAGDKFGYSLHVLDNTLVVGAIDAPNGNGIACGVAYIYTLVGSPVTNADLATKIETDDGVIGDQFGAAVLITADTIYIGSDQNSNSMGAVYTFSLAGVRLKKIYAPGAVDGDKVGHSIAVSGSTMAFGAPGRVVNGLTAAGAVFIITVE